MQKICAKVQKGGGGRPLFLNFRISFEYIYRNVNLNFFMKITKSLRNIPVPF